MKKRKLLSQDRSFQIFHSSGYKIIPKMNSQYKQYQVDFLIWNCSFTLGKRIFLLWCVISVNLDLSYQSLTNSLEGCKIKSDVVIKLGFPGGSVVKNTPVYAGDARDSASIPGSGRSPGVGNGNLLENSCLVNPMDGGAWWVQSTGSQKGHMWLSN